MKEVTVSATIIKIGNSQGFRVSKAVLEQLDAQVGDELEIKVIKKYDYKKAAEAMERLSKMNYSGGLRAIKDPSAWQREIRKDRPLPGRDYDID